MTTPETPLDVERAHEDAWYRRAIDDRFFDHEGFRRLVAWNVRAFRRLVPLHGGMQVLSIGSGLGDYEIALAPHVGRIVAVELSPVASGEARRRLAEAGVTNVEVITGAIDEQTFTPAAFDVIYAMGVFHHFLPAQRADLLQRLTPWLSPGGTLYVRDPNARGWLRRAMEAWFRRRSTMHSPQEASIDPDVLTRELVAAGYRDVRRDDVDLIAGPLPWLVRTNSRVLWTLVFAIDTAWLAVPVLRRGASQFALVARR